jgi:cysteine desulfurase
LIHGGRQEKGYRAGTENVASIVGMAEALHLSYENYSDQQNYVLGLKNCLASYLRELIPSVLINSGRFSLYSLLSISIPKGEQTEMLLLQLDQKGICVSGGSACNQGGSHVMKELGRADNFI